MVVKPSSGRWRRIGAHFEVGFYVYFWLAASVLAVIVGRPSLGAVGLVTVVPFVVAYVVRCRCDARKVLDRADGAD